MAVTPEERQFLLSQVNQLAQTQLNSLWAQADSLSSTEFAAYVVAAYPLLADQFAEMAGTLAADWFEASDPASSYVAVTAPLPAQEKLTGSAKWALYSPGVESTPQTRLAGSLQRAVFDGARDTTVFNSERTGSRYLRVARADACEFCRMLSSRQDVYLTQKSSVRVVGRSGRPRGTQKIGDKYHDHCYCQPVEVRSNQSVGDVLTADEMNRLQQWDDEYQKAVANAGSGDTKQILSAWRQLGANPAQ